LADEKMIPHKIIKWAFLPSFPLKVAYRSSDLEDSAAKEKQTKERNFC